jgi:hypothetical protein
MSEEENYVIEFGRVKWLFISTYEIWFDSYSRLGQILEMRSR